MRVRSHVKHRDTIRAVRRGAECVRFGENRNYGVNGSRGEACSVRREGAGGRERVREGWREFAKGFASYGKKGGPFLSTLKTKCTKPSVVAERDKSVGLRGSLVARHPRFSPMCCRLKLLLCFL